MSENQKEPVANPPCEAPYEPPKLQEFGTLRQLIQGAGSGDWDNQGCTVPGGAVREEDC